jgi:hypothetical protein
MLMRRTESSNALIVCPRRRRAGAPAGERHGSHQ